MVSNVIQTRKEIMEFAQDVDIPFEGKM